LIGACQPLFRCNSRKFLRNFLKPSGLRNGKRSLEFVMLKTVALALAATVATVGALTH
jgi:hypothetical protein